MEKETIKGDRPEHEEEHMEMKPTPDGQYRVACKRCGADLIIPTHQGKNGSADCTGKLIYVGWTP
jgi:hypothetical protein